MKISEIQSSDVVNFLKLETGDYSTSEITAIMAAAKSYIMSYTGLVDKTVTGETLTGSGTVFNTQYSPVATGTLKIYVSGTQVTSGFTADGSGVITFDSAPAATPTADYKSGIDAYEDLYIAFMALCQDMHDNRSVYVDSNNANKVVDSILSLHVRNLL